MYLKSKIIKNNNSIYTSTGIYNIMLTVKQISIDINNNYNQVLINQKILGAVMKVLVELHVFHLIGVMEYQQL